MKTCPTCGRTVTATAIVDAFNDPLDWQFWGEKGARFIVCQTAGHVHFRVTVGRTVQHRLAVIRGESEAWIDAERNAAERNGDLLGASRNHVDVANPDYYAKRGTWLED